MGDIVDAGARQPLWLSQVSRFLQRAAAVFEVGCRSAPLRDEPLAHLGNRFARPGIGHGDGDAVDVVKRGGTVSKGMVMGIERYNGSNLARTQAEAAIAHPDEAVAEGGVAQGHASQPTGRCDTHDRESHDPVDDAVGTRSLVEAEFGGQETQDPTDGAQADAHLSKEA